MVYLAVYFANHSVSKVFSMRSFWSFLRQVNQQGTAAFGVLLNSFYSFCVWGEAFFCVLTFMQFYR